MPPTSPRAGAGAEHPLHTGYALYVMRRQKHTRANKVTQKKDEDEATAEATQQPGQQQAADHVAVEDYEKMLKRIATFNTVEGFWRVYGHLVRPSEIPYLTDVHLFRESIRPVWEDPANRRGGKLVIKVRKSGGLGSRYWEMLLLAMIGEQFAELGNEVCGAVISVRHNEDVISVWTRNSDNHEGLAKLKELVRKCIKLPGFVSIDYKKHDTALVDHKGGNSGDQLQQQPQRGQGQVNPPPPTAGAAPPPTAGWRNRPSPGVQAAPQAGGGDWRS